MTEKDWLSTNIPGPMLLYLEGRTSDRKLRLIACAFCRPIRRFLTDDRSRHALTVAEQYIDGHATDAEMVAVTKAAFEAAQEAAALKREDRSAADAAAKAAAAVASTASGFDRPVADFVEDSAKAVTEAVSGTNNPWTFGLAPSTQAQRAAWGAASAPQSGVVRHIIGNPFRPHPRLPHVPTTVRNLAEAVYQQKQAAVGPLHDALLDAGLTDLAHHCADAAESHPKGCWAIDILTGRA